MNRRAALILIALLGMALLWWSLRLYGAGLSPDSVGYISVARALDRGDGLRLADGSLLVNQPPLYSVVLAVFAALMRANPLTIAATLNVLLFGGTVWLSGEIGLALFSEQAIALVIGAAVAVSVPLVSVTLMAWSEPLFIALFAASLLLALRYWRQPSTARLIAWAGVVSLATLTRYAGIAMIGAGIVSVMLVGHASRRARLREIGIFMAVAAGPLALWMLRNRSVSGTLAGDRSPSDASMWQNIARSASVIGGWLAPGIASGPWPVILFGTLALLVVDRSWRREGSEWLRAASARWSPVWLVALCYAGFLLLTATYTELDPLDDRLWSPLVVPLVLLVVMVIRRGTRLAAGGRAALPITALLLWLTLPLRSASGALSEYREAGGIGYSDRVWRESETIAYLHIQPPDCHIYSNQPDAITILTGAPAELSPLRSEHGSARITPLPAGWPAEQRACLVWFAQESWDDLWPLDTLRTRAQMELVKVLRDGTVYRLHL